MPPPRRHRKRIRLDAHVYAEMGRICSITIAVQDRCPVFANPMVAGSAVDVLRQHASRTGVLVYALCVMPDHVHLVVGPSVGCDRITFVAQFKNLAQRAAWSRGVSGRFWQPSFWDRFLRSEEHLQTHVQYVLDNPVRAGLVTSWRDYPFAGSLVLQL